MCIFRVAMTVGLCLQKELLAGHKQGKVELQGNGSSMVTWQPCMYLYRLELEANLNLG